MVIYTLHSRLPNAKADEFYNFMTNVPAEMYANWLPEEHYEFHVVKRSNNSPKGDLFYFDQNIGKKYRMKFYAIIRVANKPNRIVFQMRKLGINLPGYLELDFSDTDDGLLLTETLRIGLNGIGKICDPFIKIVYGKRFYCVFGEHHKREWQNLSEIMQ
ncbi:MAG: hypothetical protein FWH16_01220 [Oscillospiraceae bacterium]|nr:hypothetical protein [Oscillospiraceae bacterium]